MESPQLEQQKECSVATTLHSFSLIFFYIIKKPRQSVYNKHFILAGMEGFEPPNGGTRTRCLTTWRHPNAFQLYQKKFWFSRFFKNVTLTFYRFSVIIKDIKA